MSKLKIRTALISQPKPAEPEKSPYYLLTKKYGIKVDFKKFFKVERFSAREFREQKVYLEQYPAVIFTSRLAVDNFFSLAKDMRHTPKDDTKYFCLNENIALYLQKYITYRKRKIFFCDNNYDELKELLLKHTDSKVLLPCSDEHNECLPNYLFTNNFNFTKAVISRNTKENLKDLDANSYDMLVFFSPFGVRSFKENFPDYIQGDTIIAAHGDTTTKALIEHGLRLDIGAPNEKFSSLIMAIEDFIVQLSKKK